MAKIPAPEASDKHAKQVKLAAASNSITFYNEHFQTATLLILQDYTLFVQTVLG